MRFLNNTKGFTLVEIVVAIGIIAILASVVFFNLQDGKKKARDVERRSDLANIELAVRGYRDLYSTSTLPAADGGELFSGSNLESKIGTFLVNQITDPLNVDEYQYYYDSAYTCNGSSRAVILALTMEGSNGGNYADVCGASTEQLGISVTPTVNTYIVILK